MYQLLAVLALFAVSTTAAAQQSASAACPRLPEGASLSWEHKPGNEFDLCRAMREDGSEAFGLYIARKSPFKPARTHREHKGTIDGQEIWWHRAELATNPGTIMRETLVELPDGRVAHLWVQAVGEDELAATLRQAEGLRFQNGPMVGKK